MGYRNGSLLNEKPAMFRIISMTTNFPRQLAFDVSPCHTGAVDYGLLIGVGLMSGTGQTNSINAISNSRYDAPNHHLGVTIRGDL